MYIIDFSMIYTCFWDKIRKIVQYNIEKIYILKYNLKENRKDLFMEVIMIKKIEENEFEKEVLNNKKMVVVDFFATWCGPCQMLMPVLENIA